MQKQGLSRKEVADRYGVHINTVDRWVKRGLLQPSRFVGTIYFTDDALCEFERKATVKR